jgi:ribosomal protein L40E
MSQRLLGRRCAAGHPIDGANGNWQLSGRGVAYLVCRACNALRAKRWRAANAHRLVYRPGRPKGGKVLAR